MDPVSVSLLAGAAVKFLGPYLSDLAGKTVDSLIDKTASSASGSAFKAAGRLLELVRTKFSGNDEAENSLEALTSVPSDPNARAAVESHMKAELDRDPDFASAVSTHLTQIANTHADLAFVNNIQGDVGKLAQFGTVIGDVTF